MGLLRVEGNSTRRGSCPARPVHVYNRVSCLSKSSGSCFLIRVTVAMILILVKVQRDSVDQPRGQCSHPKVSFFDCCVNASHHTVLVIASGQWNLPWPSMIASSQIRNINLTRCYKEQNFNYNNVGGIR